MSNVKKINVTDIFKLKYLKFKCNFENLISIFNSPKNFQIKLKNII